MKTCNAFIRNLRLSAVMLLCVASALLTPPHAALAQGDPQDGLAQVDPQDVIAQPPTVSSVAIISAAPTTGYYKAGDTIQATVTFDEAVNVTGAPQLTLNIGGAKPAGYTSGSGSTTLVFGYTVVSGDADADGISIDANQLASNGTITAADDDTPATLTHAGLGTQPLHKVDTTVPIVSSVVITSTAVNGIYKAGDVIQAMVTFSESVTGTPQLTLNVGGIGKPAAYVSGSGTTQLVFGYTVVSGDEDTDGVSIDGLSGAIADVAGNLADLTNAVLPAQVTHKVDATAPAVSGVAMSSTAVNGVYKLGETIQALVSFSEAVAVSDAPQLTLNIGGIGKPAAYVSGSGTTQLVFGYTVVSGDEDTDGVSIDGLSGAIADAAGNLADLTNAVLGAQATHSVDATAPAVSGVAMSSTAVNGVYKLGETIQALVSFSEAVAVSDAPQLTLNIGGIGKPAAYVSGSGTTQLVFGYTVVSGDEDTDGVSIDGLSGAIADAAGNLADLTNAVLPAQATHKVDTSVPTVSSVAITSTPSNGTYKLGETIQAAVTFSETLNVTVPIVPPPLPRPVPPQLTLTIGVSGKRANYTSGSGTATLVFEYTVALGDEDIDGIEIGANQLSLNSGTITDSAGNAATLTHTPLAPHPLHRVDTSVPTVSGVAITSVAPNGTYKLGETIQAAVTFSEVVTVADSPQLTLTIGAAYKNAVYVSGSGTASLVFAYTVVAGDEDVDGISIEADKLAGTITDVTGNAALLTHAALGAQPLHRVDTSVPTVSGVAMSSTAVNGVYKLGETIQATVSFSEVVTVSDLPQLTLNIGGIGKPAAYVSGSGTTQLVFEYTVVSGDEDTDGVSIDGLSGTVTDTTGNLADLTNAVLGAQATHRVDTTVPTVSGVAVTSTAVNGVYKAGETIQTTVTFSEVVVVADLPQLTLNIGGVVKSAVYVSGSGTTQLVFGYTVVAGDEDTDGISIDGNQLLGTITDVTGNAALLTHAALGVQAPHTVDATLPTVSGVAMSSTPSNGTYTTGDTIEATVSFSEVVNVTGAPTLTLTIGTENKIASYTSGSGTGSLIFGYTVVVGDEDTDGIEIQANQLSGTITDTAGNAATLTHTALPAQASHKVDTTPIHETGEVSGQELVQSTVQTPGQRTGPPPGQQPPDEPLVGGPEISSLSISSTGPYRTGDNVEVTVSTSENIIVTGTPTLTLIVGTTDRTGSYNRGHQSSGLVFRYTVVAGDTDTDGIAVKANSLGLAGGTLDGRSGALTLSHSAITDAGTSHIVDTTAPAVATPNGIAMSSTPSNGTYTTGDTIEATATFDEAVNVTGAPQLTLKIGTENKTASYTSGSGTGSLVFGYTVIAGDTDADGIEIAANQLVLNSGTIKDSVGNAATLRHTALTTQTSHKVDTTDIQEPGEALAQQGPSTGDPWPPRGTPPNWDPPQDSQVGGPEVSSLAITSKPSSNSTYKKDETIQVTVTFTEAVKVTGTPTLTLKIGSADKTANYTTTGSTTTALVFSYTVVGGDTDTDGIEIEEDKLSGTITDAVGGTAYLEHDALNAQSRHKVDTTSNVSTTPTVSSLAIRGTNPPYGVDDKVEAVVTFSESVTVTGTPQLTLKVGTADKTIDYKSGSPGTSLVFEYTVVNGDTDTDGISIKANKLSLNGGTINATAGSTAANLNHDALMAQASHTVDTTKPTIVTTDGITITSTATNDTYNTGDTIQVTVTFTETVKVTGTPQLTLKFGTTESFTNKTANYTSGSGTASLVFGYTVVSGDSDTDGIEIEADKLTLNSGTITDTAGNSATLTHAALGAQATHKVDATNPGIVADGISITSTAGDDNTYKAGDTIQVTVTFSESVTVTGTPQLKLRIGTENKTADYESGSPGTALVFEYTVAANDTDTDGISIAADQLSGTINATDDNAAAALNYRALSTQSSHRVDTTAPTVSRLEITSTATNDYYNAGDTIRVQVTFSESVTVTNTPQLTLKIGSAEKTANYTTIGSTATALVFAYTVASDDEDTDGISIAAGKLSLNGGTITDAVGHAAELTYTALQSQASHKVGTNPIQTPWVSSVAITSSAGTDNTYKIGDKIQVTVAFNESVDVTGTPQVTLTIGSAEKPADYESGTGTASLVFAYTVAAKDEDTDGISIAANKLVLNGGTINATDDSTAATLTHTALSTQASHKVDGVIPTIVIPNGVTITSTPKKGGTYKTGETIETTVTFSESVVVTNTPQLTLTIGSAEKTVNYASGTGTTELQFDYEVVEGDVDTDGIEIAADTLALNNGTITDAAGNAATLTHGKFPSQSSSSNQGARGAFAAVSLAEGSSGSSSPNVDAIKPTVSSIAITGTAPTTGFYKQGDKIQATVTFSEVVNVTTGTPQLQLTIGTQKKAASYTTGTGTTALVFEYTVANLDNDTDGISIDANQLTAPENTIKDTVDNEAVLTHGALPAQTSRKVDTIVPNISSIRLTSTPGSDSTYQLRETIQVQMTFNEVVNVTGIPQLTLKIGWAYKNAPYTGGTGTQNLFFTYTVVPGDMDADGIAIEANALAGMVTDAAGNAAYLTNTSLGTQTGHKVDATDPTAKPAQPAISSVALTSTGPYGIWDHITVKVTTTTPVMVTGSPTVAVVIGNKEKRASYQSGSGSAALVFQYTVAAGDGDDPNGISVRANSLKDGTVKDAASNTLTLNPNHPALPDQGVTHQVDTTAPKVSSLAFTSTGPYSIGSAIQVTATISEAVTVTGKPTLTVLVGSKERTASYQSGTGTTALVFQYTVAAADTDDTDGVSVKGNSLKLNSGTVLDTAGNALKLTHSSLANGGNTHAVGITVSGISSVALTSTGPYSLKDVIKITVTTSEKVTVTGTPRIPLRIGTDAMATADTTAMDTMDKMDMTDTTDTTPTENGKYANYVSGTGTTSLVFQYTVVAGDSDTDGIEIAQNALENYNGSTIKSSYHTDLNLSHAGIPADTQHIVDTTQPVITAVAFATEAPTVYTVGSTIEVILTFAETGVKVTPDPSGTMPSLSLLFGSNADPDSQKTAVEASYKEARPGSTKLVFSYTVTAETPIDTDGVQIQAGSLKIPAGAAIMDASENVIAVTPSGDGGSFVDIKPASRLSSHPILPSVTSTGIVFNEFLNAKTDKQDWVELRNTTENEISLGGWKLDISVGNAAQTESVAFPDTMLPAGAVLLLVNTLHGETHLERSQAYTYRYLKAPELRLRGSNFSLMLRDRSGSVVDAISNHAATADAAEPGTGFAQDTAYLREAPSTPGYEVSAWQASGYQGGLGYDRKAPKETSLGTPGYLRSGSLPQEAPVSVHISEVMFTTGTTRRLPQWIELYNASKTEVVTLQGWRLQVEVLDLNGQPPHRFVTLIINNALQILPNQTVLVVTKNGRNSQHFPEPRLYTLTEQNPEKVEQLGPNADLLGGYGYAIVLRDAAGNQIDIAGNLDGHNNTFDEPSWKLPNCITPNGFRASLIRQYEDGLPLAGDKKSSWFRATEMRRQIITYYGHPKDIGNPGWKKGGPLPVQLSSFRAERTEQGALIKWTTESELENAGFNVLRSETKTGTFTRVTPRMLQGAGTTSERSSYEYVDTTAKANVAYYYRLVEVSFAGVQQPVATRRLRGHVSAANRYLTTFGSLKKGE